MRRKQEIDESCSPQSAANLFGNSGRDRKTITVKGVAVGVGVAHTVHILTAVSVPPLKIHLLLQSFVWGALGSVATLRIVCSVARLCLLSSKWPKHFYQHCVPPLLALDLPPAAAPAVPRPRKVCRACVWLHFCRLSNCLLPPPHPLCTPFRTQHALWLPVARGACALMGVASCPCATLLACRLWQLQLPLPLARLAHCNIRFRFRCAACAAPFSLSLSLSL